MFQKKSDKKSRLLENPLKKLETNEKKALNMNQLKQQVGRVERER